MSGTMDGRDPHGAQLEKGQARPTKFSDFKPVQSDKTPMSMMQNHITNDDPYREQSRGVVPGYQGHVPRARDAFGTSAMGGLAPDPNIGAHKKMGAMTGHETNKHVLGLEDVDTVFPQYKDKKQGVMPGYAGFRPGARDHHHQSAFGGIERTGMIGQGPDLKGGWDQGRGGPGVDYRGEVRGILPGYTGHIPEAINKHGTSHFGGIDQPGRAGYSGPMLGHETVGIDYDKAFEVSKMVKAGYSGHVQGARDSYGTTTCNPE